MSELLKVTHLKKVYSAEGYKAEVIRDMSFTVNEGEFVSIMGASGSGKTTLLNCISAIDSATDGEICIAGTEIHQLGEKRMASFRRENLGFVFQDFNLLDTLTVSENIALAMTINHIPQKEIKDRIRRTAEQLNITSILNKFPYEISGGEKQRCACARAIVNQPKLVLADEPTGALDSTASSMLLETLKYMNDKLGSTLIIVTHDVFVAAQTKRILFMKDGKIYRELLRTELDQKQYLMEIMETASGVGGANVS